MLAFENGSVDFGYVNGRVKLDLRQRRNSLQTLYSKLSHRQVNRLGS